MQSNASRRSFLEPQHSFFVSHLDEGPLQSHSFAWSSEELLRSSNRCPMDLRKRCPSGPCALTPRLRGSSVDLGRHPPVAGQRAGRESQPGRPGGQEVNFGSFAAEKHGGKELPQARGAVGALGPEKHSW
eukprot:s4665_g9.t1